MKADTLEDVVRALKEAGFDYPTVSDLRESGTRYVGAIPILIEALESATTEQVTMSVARALSVPWAKPAAIAPLIAKFRQVANPERYSLGWAIGNGLEILWDDAYFDDLVELAQDTRYGRAREMIVFGMRKSKRPEAGQILIGLLDDPDVNGHATDALARMKLPTAAPGLTRMLDDHRAWVRKAARRGLDRIS